MRRMIYLHEEIFNDKKDEQMEKLSLIKELSHRSTLGGALLAYNAILDPIRKWMAEGKKEE